MRPGFFRSTGNPAIQATEAFLQTYMRTFDDFVRRVLTVLPQQG